MPNSKPIGPSNTILQLYRAGLCLYPSAYRDRFGREMEQVFRTQWLDVRAARSVVAILNYAFQTVIDLLVTATRERLAALRNLLNPRGSMSSWLRLGWSVGAGVPVAALVLGLAIYLTLLVPSTYMSRTRILVRSMITTGHSDPFSVSTEKELILSVDTLRRVVEELSLTNRWSPTQIAGRHPTLETMEAVSILRNRVSVHSIRDTPVLEVRVHENNRQLAADIANAVARVFVLTDPDSRSGPGNSRRTIIDLAEPSSKPVRPNIPLNVFVGLMVGGALGGLTSAVVWRWLRSRTQPFISVRPV